MLILDTQKIMKELFDADLESDRLRGKHWDTMGSEIEAFQKQLRVRLEESAVDPDVVAFKSIVCYRTGLDVQTSHRRIGYWERFGFRRSRSMIMWWR